MRRNQVGLRVGGAAAALALAATLVGCGRADGGGQVTAGNAEVKTLSAAAARTEQLDTATFELSALTTPKADDDMVITGSVDRSRDLAESRVGPSPADPSGSDVTPTELIVAGTLVYLKGSDLASDYEASTPWVSGDTAAWRKNGWMTVGLEADPFAWFSADRDTLNGIMAFLQTISTGVTEEGTADVDGTATTHYQAHVPMATVEARIQQQLDETLGTTFGTDASPVGTEPPARGTLTIDVWIDGNGVIRRFVGSAPSEESSSESEGLRPGNTTGTERVTTTSAVSTITFDLLTVNQPVTITVPPADQVTKVDLGRSYGYDPRDMAPSATTSTTGG